MVSSPAPGTFVHIAHVGVNERGEIETSDDIEPGWTMMLEELQGYSVPKRAATLDKDFKEGRGASGKESKENQSAAFATETKSEH